MKIWIDRKGLNVQLSFILFGVLSILLLGSMLILSVATATEASPARAACVDQSCSLYLPLVSVDCPTNNQMCRAGASPQPTTSTESDTDPVDVEPTPTPLLPLQETMPEATQQPEESMEPQEESPMDPSMTGTVTTPPVYTLVGDLGDAPESISQTGIAMSAYITGIAKGIPALYPSIYISGTKSGPFHHASGLGIHLGEATSLEFNADQLPDEDAVTNISPLTDAADRDTDDGFVAAYGLEEPCSTADVAFEVGLDAENFIDLSQVAFANIYLDFNRDGQWNAYDHCHGIGPVTEHPVQNMRLILIPGVTQIFTATFVTFEFPELISQEPIWMRITVSGQQTELPNDGRGPSGGFPDGETEDILLSYPEVPPEGGSRVGWDG